MPMASVVAFITLVASLVLLAGVCEAVSCYQCDSMRGAGCGYPLNEALAPVTPNCTACVALAAETSLGRVYIRDCTTVLVELDQYQAYIYQIESLTARQCWDDLCNVMDPSPPEGAETTRSPMACGSEGGHGAMAARLMCLTGIAAWTLST